ncbi:MAG: YraN family protein [Saprospiraceae bacterium]|nr:YraN family protein [Saprospiraceae bacterium]
MAKHNELGIMGESLALDFLIKKGYSLQAKNWTWGNAEIDIIMWDQNILVFIEVKTRTKAYFGAPDLAITPKKQALMYELASEYLHRIQYEGEIRFDIVGIIIEPQQTIEHHKDAFFPTW